MKMHVQYIGYTTGADRLTADSVFTTRQLVRAPAFLIRLNIPLIHCSPSRMYACPTAVSAYSTWQLEVNEDLVRQHGAIQMRTTDGSPNCFRWIDKSDEIPAWKTVSVTTRTGWAQFYYPHPDEQGLGDEKIYTLLSDLMTNSSSSKKIIEILNL